MELQNAHDSLRQQTKLISKILVSNKVSTIGIATSGDEDEHRVDSIDLLFTENRPLSPHRLTLDKYRDYFEEIRTDNDVDIEVCQL